MKKILLLLSGVSLTTGIVVGCACDTGTIDPDKGDEKEEETKTDRGYVVEDEISLMIEDAGGVMRLHFTQLGSKVTLDSLNVLSDNDWLITFKNLKISSLYEGTTKTDVENALQGDAYDYGYTFFFDYLNGGSKVNSTVGDFIGSNPSWDKKWNEHINYLVNNTPSDSFKIEVYVKQFSLSNTSLEMIRLIDNDVVVAEQNISGKQ